MTDGLPVPPELQRSAHTDRDEWVASGVFATQLLAETLGRDDLDGVSVLDVGCGTKVVKTLLDHQWPVGRYVGVDVSADVISWLDENVTDPRFEFHHFEARNDLYNPTGPRLAEFDRLPVGDEPFDLICLFSVFTHLGPDDYRAMLRLTRRHVQPDGRLLFSVFIDEPDAPSPVGLKLQAALESDDPEVRARIEAAIAERMEASIAAPIEREDGYWEAVPDQPLLQSRYTREKALELIDGSGWEVLSVAPRSQHMQHRVVCRPVERS
jgi:SAM-dependent methyltransferase